MVTVELSVQAIPNPEPVHTSRNDTGHGKFPGGLTSIGAANRLPDASSRRNQMCIPSPEESSHANPNSLPVHATTGMAPSHALLIGKISLEPGGTSSPPLTGSVGSNAIRP